MRAPRAHVRELGSAYLLALTALLALTGLGLALSRVGSIERSLGVAHERRQHALNAAESGLSIAVAEILAESVGEDLEIEFGASGEVPALVTTSRTSIDAPVLLSSRPCETCAPLGDELSKVSYGLVAIGERVARQPVVELGSERVLARVSIEAVVTLQPWPPAAAEEGVAEPSVTDPACELAEVRERVTARLLAELNPPGCRLAPVTIEVGAEDLETGATCTTRVPVCVLVSDWRER